MSSTQATHADALVLRGMADRPRVLLEAVTRLARHYRRSPDTLTAEEVQHYLLHFCASGNLSRSSVNQYGCAYRFLYGTVLGLNGESFQIPWLRRRRGCRRSSRARSSVVSVGVHRALKVTNVLMLGYAPACACRSGAVYESRHRQCPRPHVRAGRPGQGGAGSLRTTVARATRVLRV